MLKKASFYFAALIAGVALVALSFLFTDDSIKAVGGVMIGVGAGLTGMSLASLLMKRYEKKHPDIARQNQIEQGDERNKMIHTRARATAGTVIQWLVIILAFVLILADAPLWQTLTVVGVFVAYHVLFLVLTVRYQKLM
jgi:Flp pilus assembly protein TadB